MARLATLVRRLRAAHPNVVFAHAGDMLSPSPMSTALRGAQMIATLNAVGLELATFGNHEFDFGVRVLGERMAESRFAWLSANVLERGDPRPLGVATRDRMLERGGVRLGFFGLTTADAATASAGRRDAEVREPLAGGPGRGRGSAPTGRAPRRRPPPPASAGRSRTGRRRGRRPDPRWSRARAARRGGGQGARYEGRLRRALSRRSERLAAAGWRNR